MSSVKALYPYSQLPAFSPLTYTVGWLMEPSKRSSTRRPSAKEGTSKWRQYQPVLAKKRPPVLPPAGVSLSGLKDEVMAQSWGTFTTCHLLSSVVGRAKN